MSCVLSKSRKVTVTSLLAGASPPLPIVLLARSQTTNYFTPRSTNSPFPFPCFLLPTNTHKHMSLASQPSSLPLSLSLSSYFVSRLQISAESLSLSLPTPPAPHPAFDSFLSIRSFRSWCAVSHLSHLPKKKKKHSAQARRRSTTPPKSVESICATTSYWWVRTRLPRTMRVGPLWTCAVRSTRG